MIEYYELIEKYKNHIAKIELRKDSQSFKKYGRFIRGTLDLPIPERQIWKEIEKIEGQVTIKQQLPVNICVRMTAGCKMIHKNLTEVEFKELEMDGFNYFDIFEIQDEKQVLFNNIKTEL